jgi:diacylglycerol kinase family enzyme
VQRSGLIGRAVRRGITCVIVRAGDDLREIAEREAAGGATVLGMAGGDGSQAIVADVARRHRIAFVCVPAGTRNHLAQDLGIERRKPVRALDAFGPAVERRMDLGTVNGHVFVNNASMGVYGAIVQAQTYRAAKLLTAAGLLPDLVGPEAAPFDLRFTGPDGTAHETTDLLLVSNNPYAVVTSAGVGGRPRLDAGELGILSIRRAEAGPLAWSATSFRVDSGGPVAVGLDGEAVTLSPPLEFATLPGALRVRLAPHVVAPAAVGRAPGVTQTVRSLVRIAFGRSRPAA